MINGVESEIKVNWIKGLGWDTKKGQLIIYCNIDYYVNEYHEDYKEPDKKKDVFLKVIK